MRKDILTRIARLEAKFGMRKGNEAQTKWGRFKWALMDIVAFHAGKFSSGESLAAAFARALGMKTMDLKNALSPDNRNGPDIWAIGLEKLNALVAARGGRLIAENGKLVVEARQDDDRRDGFEVLDELYQEIPDEFKKRFNLLPTLADYVKEATSAGSRRSDAVPSDPSPGD